MPVLRNDCFLSSTLAFSNSTINQTSKIHNPADFSRLGYFQLPANGFNGSFCNLPMPGHSGDFPIFRIGIDSMVTTFSLKDAALLLQVFF
jgi:hypothetical protein